MPTPDDLIEQAYALRRAGNAASSLQTYQAAAAAFGPGNPNRRAHCLRHIGDLALELGKLDEAGAALREAEQIYRTTVDDPLSLANTLRLRGLLSGDKAAWTEARALYDSLAREHGLDLKQALSECDARLTKG